jgi:predicted naringenin-chalcone synthase
VEKKPPKLYPYMLGLATGNPKYKVTQKDALKVAMAAPGCEKIRSVLERIYSNTRISNRYMAIPDFTPADKDPNDDYFYPEGSYSVPVQSRLEKFKEGYLLPFRTQTERNVLLTFFDV